MESTVSVSQCQIIAPAMERNTLLQPFGRRDKRPIDTASQDTAISVCYLKYSGGGVLFVEVGIAPGVQPDVLESYPGYDVRKTILVNQAS